MTMKDDPENDGQYRPYQVTYSLWGQSVRQIDVLMAQSITDARLVFQDRMNRHFPDQKFYVIRIERRAFYD